MLKEAGTLVAERTTNWTIGPCPTPLGPRSFTRTSSRRRGARAARAQLEHVLRLDEEDPWPRGASAADMLVGVRSG